MFFYSTIFVSSFFFPKIKTPNLTLSIFNDIIEGNINDFSFKVSSMSRYNIITALLPSSYCAHNVILFHQWFRPTRSARAPVSSNIGFVFIDSIKHFSRIFTSKCPRQHRYYFRCYVFVILRSITLTILSILPTKGKRIITPIVAARVWNVCLFEPNGIMRYFYNNLFL